jgi:hypothetical protein
MPVPPLVTPSMQMLQSIQRSLPAGAIDAINASPTFRQRLSTQDHALLEGNVQNQATPRFPSCLVST